ncbi:MAG TPA: helix-turn-helix domain-containing protein [Rhizomicrobium sp.]|jgi:AcrR family transcriptional regulator
MSDRPSRQPPARAPRADARKNRERLLDVALELFTASRDEVTLSAVAQRAGVGIGTLYRHFPTRDALVEAVYRNEVERLSDAAPKLLRKMSAEAALEEWLARYSALIVAKRGLSDALKTIFAPGSETVAYSRDRLRAAVTLLLEAATKADAIRGDVDPQDVLLAVAASAWSFAGDKDWKERAGRVRRLVIDGLRYRPQ